MRMNPSLLLLYLFLSPLYHPIISLLSSPFYPLFLSSSSSYFIHLILNRWGTRTAHILTIALPLSFFDHLSLKVWNNSLLPKLGYPTGTSLSSHLISSPLLSSPLLFSSLTYVAGTLLSMSRTPVPFIIHAVSYAPSSPPLSPPPLELSSLAHSLLLFLSIYILLNFLFCRFAFTGIMTYVGWDAFMNPNYATSEQRTEAFTSKVCSPSPFPRFSRCLFSIHSLMFSPLPSRFPLPSRSLLTNLRHIQNYKGVIPCTCFQ